jgi:nitrite reductase/ring-hydroxylating ferredoxin subunit
MTTITLCHADDIEERSSKGFTIDEANFFAVKYDNQIYLYKNSCPHLGIELEWQEDQFLDSDGALIQCSTHGALFIIESGECVAGPCLGEQLKPVPFDLNEQGHVTVASETLSAL